MLEVRGVSVDFGATRALNEVTLSLRHDEVVAVLGASGSGKTTLLRVIAGLLAPDRGEVLWEGRDLSGVPAHRRRFGIVFQDFALFPHLDVAGNVGYGLRMSAVSGNTLEERVEAALSRVGLQGLAHRRIDELSGGQAQRVALARTLAPEPALLLLDEPLGSLDPALRTGLAADLAATLAAASVPALVVTHDTDEAFALADRIAVLDGGRLIRNGTPEELWHDPRMAAVAELLGHTVIDATSAPQLWADLGGPSAIALAVRSDAVHLGQGDHEGSIVASAFRGPGHVVTLDADGARLRAVTADRMTPGARVRFSIDPEGTAPLSG